MITSKAAEQVIIRLQRTGSKAFKYDQIRDVWDKKAKHGLINKNVTVYQRPGGEGRLSHSKLQFIMMNQGSTVC